MHGRGGAELAAMLKTWSGDVVYFADDARLTRRELRRLEAAGVALGTGPVAGLSGQDGVLEHVLLSDGRTVPRRALFLKLEGRRQRSDLALQLGLRVTQAAGVVHGARGATAVRGGLRRRRHDPRPAL